LDDLLSFFLLLIKKMNTVPELLVDCIAWSLAIAAYYSV
jgi:hypothetical protein